jgi:hypothetical protein
MSRRLKDWLDSYMQFTDNTEPPKIFRLWCGISCIAAALQRKCRLEWGLSTVYPNMYILLVGPSGVRKGTAMSPVGDILKKVGIKTSAQSTSRSALIKELMKVGTQVPITKDGAFATVEMHSSLTIFSEEFTVFLGYNNQEMMAVLCDWFDCKDPWIDTTHTHGEREIHNVWINLLGATTPDILQVALPRESIGGGLTSRIVFVYADKKGKHIPFPFLTDELKSLGMDLVADLEKIYALSGRFTPDEGFLERWYSWYTYIEDHPAINNPRFDGYNSRRAVHTLKLCMILNASRGGDMVLTRLDLDRAIAILEDAERNMSKVFEGVGANPLAQAQARIMLMVRTHGTINVKTLMSEMYSDISVDDLSVIIATLEATGFLTYDIMKKTLIYKGGPLPDDEE